MERDSEKAPLLQESKRAQPPSVPLDAPPQGAIETINASFNAAPRGEKMRFVALATFVLCITTNNIQYITTSTIVKETRDFFGISAAEVNLLPALYMIAYILLAYVSCFLQKVGLWECVVVGGLTNLTGAILKVVATVMGGRYWVLVIAQSFCAVSQVCLLSCPPLLSSIWFPPKERATATAIAAIAVNVGIALGMLLPPQIVKEATEKAFLFLFVFQAILALVSFAAVYFTPKGPRAPPSDTSPTSRKGQEEAVEGEEAAAFPPSPTDGAAIIREIRVMLRNVPFCFLLVGASITVGTTWAISTVFTETMLPFDVPESDVGWMSFLNIVAGSLTAALVGVLIDRFHAFKPFVVGLTFFATISFASLVVALMYGSAPVTAGYVTYISAGAFVNSVVPIAFEYAVELTYPQSESVSSTLLMFVASIVALSQVGISSCIMDNNATRTQGITVLLLFTALLALAGIILLPIRSLLLRHEYEKKCQAERDAARQARHSKKPISS